ncbi:MAG TPA: hypothetical protein VMW10_05800 [Alphaproteobacteria bacterium]|nr:hypothetical protein [Alphaproteobacteria bacterium]
MAFFTELEEQNIHVIVFNDAAIKGTSRDDYDEYIKDLDESKLIFVENGLPTRFIMRKILPYKLSMKLKNSQVAMKDGALTPQLSFMNEEVRLALVGIDNPVVSPEYQKHLLEYKQHGDGGASDAVMEKLEAFGVVTDLYTVRQAHAPKSSLSETDKKK